MSNPGYLSSDPASALTFDRPVDRALIHRRNSSEAFLTDLVRTGPRGFAAAALLPEDHPHYSAHTGPSARRDPLLLLECVRQAVTYAAHTLFGVQPDVKFVLRAMSATFPAAIASAGPTDLVLTASHGNPRVVRDRVQGLDTNVELWAGGAWAGRARMDIAFISAAAYAIIRSRKHGGPPPSSDDFIGTEGNPVAPASAGRTRETDTVLLDVEHTDGRITAGLRVPSDNPSYFDHTQDHVPGMVLVEAARQLAALAVEHTGGAEPDRTQLVGLTAEFGSYAELNEPVELLATPAGHRSFDVTIRQAATEIASTRISMAVFAKARRIRRTGG